MGPRGALAIATSVAACLGAGSCLASTGERVAPVELAILIDAVSVRHRVDASLIAAMVAVESGGHAGAMSPKGALGLMQLMPDTARRYGETDPRRLLRADVSLELGTRHLRMLLDRYHGHAALALAAYNAGDGAVTRHGQRIPPYRETQLYVAAVLARAAAIRTSFGESFPTETSTDLSNLTTEPVSELDHASPTPFL